MDRVKTRINGANTQGENIADNGGIKQAFLVSSRYVTSNILPNPRMNLTFSGVPKLAARQQPRGGARHAGVFAAQRRTAVLPQFRPGMEAIWNDMG